jgi:type I restriction enzyme R subunit
MASADYSEDNNIQEPAAKLFADNLDWRSVYAFNAETFGPASLLGRKDATEVVLVRELDAALAKLNPKLAATPEGRAKFTSPATSCSTPIPPRPCCSTTRPSGS